MASLPCISSLVSYDEFAHYLGSKPLGAVVGTAYSETRNPLAQYLWSQGRLDVRINFYIQCDFQMHEHTQWTWEFVTLCNRLHDSRFFKDIKAGVAYDRLISLQALKHDNDPVLYR